MLTSEEGQKDDAPLFSPYETSGVDLIENAIPVDASTAAAIQQSNFDERGINGDPTRQQTKSGQHGWCKRLAKQQADVLRSRGHLHTSGTYGAGRRRWSGCAGC